VPGDHSVACAAGLEHRAAFAPRIFSLTGLGQQAALLQSVGIGITNLIFTFVGLWLIDRLGHRTLLLIGSLGYNERPVFGREHDGDDIATSRRRRDGGPNLLNDGIGRYQYVRSTDLRLIVASARSTDRVAMTSHGRQQ
jgi:hypothetical protein